MALTDVIKNVRDGTLYWSDMPEPDLSIHGPGLPVESAVRLFLGLRDIVRTSTLDGRRSYATAHIGWKLVDLMRKRSFGVWIAGEVVFDDQATCEEEPLGLRLGAHRWIDIVRQERAARIGPKLVVVQGPGSGTPSGNWSEEAQVYRADGGQLVVAYGKVERFYDGLTFGPLSFMLGQEFADRVINQRDLLRTILPLLEPADLVALDREIELMAEAS